MQTSTQSVSTEVAQLASEIQSRIAALEALFEDSLDDEMDALKEVLVSNPSATALLKDEDIGQLVIALRRTVSDDIKDAIEAKAKGKTRAPKKGTTKLTAEEIAAALAADGL